MSKQLTRVENKNNIDVPNSSKINMALRIPINMANCDDEYDVMICELCYGHLRTMRMYIGV